MKLVFFYSSEDGSRFTRQGSIKNWRAAKISRLDQEDFDVTRDCRLRSKVDRKPNYRPATLEKGGLGSSELGERRSSRGRIRVFAREGTGEVNNCKT